MSESSEQGDARRQAGSGFVPPLSAPDVDDPVVEAYKKYVDRTLIRENLKLTHEQRLQKLEDFVAFLVELRNSKAGGGAYEEVLPYSEELNAFGLRCRCVILERLIQLKRSAGRPKDLEAIAELEAILAERKRTGLV